MNDCVMFSYRSYSDVDWDAKIPPKIKPCPSTLEKSPDPISQRLNAWSKTYAPVADISQVRTAALLYVLL